MLGLYLFRFVPGRGKQTEPFISNGSEGNVFANTISYFVFVLNEGQWEDRKQWSIGVGQPRTTF